MATRPDSLPASREAGNLRAIRRVGDALVARQAEIGQEMAKRIVDEIPDYRRASPALLEDVLAGASATAELLAHAFAAGVELRREDVESVREVARRRVHQGVSLEVFQRAYRAALFAYWDACAEQATRLKVSRDACLRLAGFALAAMDLVTTQAAEAYVREQTRVRTQSGREARDLVERLIAGQLVEETRRHAAAPGLDPTGPLAVIVGRIDSTAVPVTDALQAARDALQEAMSLGRTKPLVAIRQGEIVLVTTAGASARQRTSLRTAWQHALDDHDVDVHYGIGTPAAGFPGVQRAYREAALSLSYSSSSRPIVSLEDLSSLECALITADATTRAVIASKGDSLRGLSNEELTQTSDTVRAFAAADLNVARAAAAMYVHPNTVRYRLAGIAASTGHDPRTFAGLAELVCVLETLEPHSRGEDHLVPR
jgi:sugar diacid utilization regulator